MEGTGWRHWVGFGVFGLIVIGLTLLVAGWVITNVFFKSCGC
jgi:hypothetical protein